MQQQSLHVKKGKQGLLREEMVITSRKNCMEGTPNSWKRKAGKLKGETGSDADSVFIATDEEAVSLLFCLQLLENSEKEDSKKKKKIKPRMLWQIDPQIRHH